MKNRYTDIMKQINPAFKEQRKSRVPRFFWWAVLWPETWRPGKSVLKFTHFTLYWTQPLANSPVDLRDSSWSRKTFYFSFRETCQLSDEELEESAKKLIQSYNGDPGEDLVTEVRSFRRQFLKELQDDSSVSVLDMYNILIDARLQVSMPELVTACVFFMTLPVTAATAERSFSKLKIIKTYLRSTMSQERLDGLAIISIEHECATSTRWSKNLPWNVPVLTSLDILLCNR